MRVFVAGASGTIGSRLVPILVARRHEVVGTTTSPEGVTVIERLGGRAVVVDLLDAGAVKSVVRSASPDVVVHQATALRGRGANLRHLPRDLEASDRLRTTGTDHLLAAARAAGARRYVAQGCAGWALPRTGGPVKTEDDGLDPQPITALRPSVEAFRYLERSVASSGLDSWAVLRYGFLYGPGSLISDHGPITEAVRRGRLPIVGAGTGIWSFIHVDDVALATALAIEASVSGAFNVSDDEPAPVSSWLPVLASAVGGPAPRQIPPWLARLLIGQHGVAMQTEVRGAANAKAKRELGWSLVYPSWRIGFVHGLAAGAVARATDIAAVNAVHS